MTYLLLYLSTSGAFYVLFLWILKKSQGYVTLKDGFELFWYAYIPIVNVILLGVLGYETLKEKGYLDKKIL